jgi:hypothetical protein
VRVGRLDTHDAGGVAAGGAAAVSAGTATASSAPPGPMAAGPMLRLTRGEGTFGGTWQGEGSRLGTWTMGVRVYGCNLHCGLLQGVGVRPDGCDTAHTWYEQDYPQQEWAYEASVDQVLAELERRMQPRLRRGGTGMVFVTGGEPLVQGAAVGQLLRACRERGWRTQIETNGTLPPRRLGGPDCWPDDFNVSPKLATGINRGADPASKRIRPKAIAELLATGRAVWKFVAAESRTWTRSTGGSNGSGCRSTTSGSCRRAPAPPA